MPDVGDEGELPDSLPSWFVQDVPFTLETLEIIALLALAMALVGILESLLTAKLVDDITDTGSDKTARRGARAPRTSSPGSSAAWAAAP